MAIVYILTNESIHVHGMNVIKIGRTKDLGQRMGTLNTGVPLPYECHYAVEVEEKAAAIETNLHKGLASDQVGHTRGEFFKTTPEEAKFLLEIAEKMGGKDVTPPREDVKTNPKYRKELERARKRRENFNFNMVNISPGTELQFKLDDATTCKVVGARKVEFRGKKGSLSKSATEALVQMGEAPKYPVAGTWYWCYRGRTLDEIREDIASNRSPSESGAKQVSGEEVVESAPASIESPEYQEFVMKMPRVGLEAWAVQAGLDSDFVVQAGSIARGDWVGREYGPKNQDIRTDLMEKGILVPYGDKLRFEADHPFQKIGPATTIIAGRNEGGYDLWYVAKDRKKVWPEKTYGQWRKERLGDR